MRSSAEVFLDFVERLVTSKVFSDEGLNAVLEEFDGVQGVVESKLYISAYEEIARSMANAASLNDMVRFCLDNSQVLSELPAEQYYFFESLVEMYFVDGLDVSKLIFSAPEAYRKYLIRRFC